jgi:hypothetical protein
MDADRFCAVHFAFLCPPFTFCSGGGTFRGKISVPSVLAGFHSFFKDDCEAISESLRAGM